MEKKYTLDEATELLNSAFKAYDVRGLVSENITNDVAYVVGAAFVDEVGAFGKPVTIGYDMRPSSEGLANAFALGATRRGAIEAIILGLTSTDEQYFASGYLNADSAMFTASHNPAEYNGIKLSRAGAKGISKDTGLDAIRDRAIKYLVKGVPVEEKVGEITKRDILVEYVQHLRNLVPLEEARPLKIVVDAANGMGGMTVPAIFGEAAGLKSLPFKIIPMYFELDGTFPNHEANPLDPKNLVDLQKAVVKHKADLGLAFDGDADRCFIIDENGDPVSPSALGAIIAMREIERVRKDEPNAPVSILYSLTTSRILRETIEEQNAEAVRIRVGHSPAKIEMARTGAVFGGEHSAHYYFSSFWGADSGVLAAMHAIAEVSRSGLTMSQLSKKYDPYYNSGEINSTVNSVQESTEAVLAAFDGRGKYDTMDGVTFEGSHENEWYWFSLRPSNTEPLLRLNVESNVKQIMEDIRDEILEIIRK
jgi:phosphomannomutase